MTRLMTLLTLFVLVFASIVSAQERPAIEITPFYTVGGYNRTFVYSDKSSGLDNSGVKYNLAQKGFELRINSTGQLSFAFTYATGDGHNAKDFENFTDGSGRMSPSVNFTDGTTVVMHQNSKSFGMIVHYRTWRALMLEGGFVNTRVTRSDKYHFVNNTNPDDSVTTTDSFLSPHMGVSYTPRVHRLAADLRISGSPWVHYGASYVDNMTGYPTYTKNASTKSKRLDYTIGGSVDIIKNLAFAGGIRGSRITTGDSYFLYGNPFKQKPSPQHDTWRSVYFGLRYSK